MEVIGAGFGRTGTTSLKAALEELGFGPCYHMVEVFRRPEHDAVWLVAALGGKVDWRALLAGYQAAVDWPACTFYQELMDVFPDAKVLLSVRDPERWYESVANTIFQVERRADRDAGEDDHRRMIDALIWDGTFGGRFEDRRHAIEVFARHNEEVKLHVPPDRLLVYEVKQGWGPLCRFLGVPVPEGRPFPHLNDTAEFRSKVLR